MTQPVFNHPISFNILEQAVTDVIKAVAAEETALANLLELENGIIQNAKNSSNNLEEFVAINVAVHSIIKNIGKVQMLAQMKRKHVTEIIQTMKTILSDDALKE